MGRSGEWSWPATWLPIVCNNLLSRVPGIRRRKPSNLYCTGSRVRFEERIHGTWNVLTGSRFITPNRSGIPESTDNRPRDLYRCGSLGMFLVSLLYELKCLRIDLFNINCCLNVPFIIWFLYVFNSIKKTPELQCSCRVLIHRVRRPHGLFHYSANLAGILSKRFALFDTLCFGHKSGAICRYF